MGEASEVQCPRCGYDQAGTVATWTASCPVRGVCSECGLDFPWRDVLNPVFERQSRLFEVAEGRLVKSLLHTWWLACRPWRLWRRVTMVQPYDRLRLEIFVVAGLVLSYLAGSVVVAAAMLASMVLFQGLAYWEWRNHPYLDEAVGAVLPGWDVVHYGFPLVMCEDLGAVGAVAFMLVLMPLTWTLAPTTLERCGVLRRHLVRIWAYSAAGVPLVAVGSMGVGVAVWMLLALLFPARSWGGYPRAGGMVGGMVHTLLRQRAEWMFLVVLVWLLACQGWAFSRYLRLPRAWLVAGMLSLIVGLATLVLVIMAALALGGPDDGGPLP